ncbi:MAG: thioredoxin, partial [Planctomycetota bacterium]
MVLFPSTQNTRISAVSHAYQTILPGLMAVVAFFAAGVTHGDELTKTMLSVQPAQPGVPFQRVSESEVDSCTVRAYAEGVVKGRELLSADGVVLRRIVDTDGDRKTDQWRFFDEGIEVYRETDTDGDRKRDKFQWLGTAGTRSGIDTSGNGRIDRWERISAEEVTAELIVALKTRDAKRFAAISLSPRELSGLQLGATTTANLKKRLIASVKGFAEFATEQQTVGSKAKWVQFAAATPGLIPAGTNGSKKDLVVYENAVALLDNDGVSEQLLVGTIVSTAQGWRLIGLPFESTDNAVSGFFFSPESVAIAQSGSDLGVGEQAQKLYGELEAIDEKLQTASKTAAAKLNSQRADVVESLIASTKTAEERENWVRQLVDTVTAATQNGAYPGGLKRLQRIAEKIVPRDPALLSYVEYQIILTEFINSTNDGSDYVESQKTLVNNYQKFVRRHRNTPEVADAYLELGRSKEFEEKFEDAISIYKRVATDFKDSMQGKKAAGAVRRLGAVGKTLDLRGRTIENRSFQLSALRGKPVIVYYWASWSDE